MAPQVKLDTRVSKPTQAVEQEKMQRKDTDMDIEMDLPTRHRTIISDMGYEATK